MLADVIITNARLNEKNELYLLFIKDGKFIDIQGLKQDKEEGFKNQNLESEVENSNATIIDAAGQLILPALIETHIHLDKACIFSRCQLKEGTLEEAITQTAKAKASFTYDDVYQRGKKVIEKAIKQGTSFMRTHVEIDPVIGLISFNAIKQLKIDYAWAMTIELCVFPQEGLHNNPGTYELLEQTLQQGADLLGGCPYTDSEPQRQIETLFKLASKYDVDLDFHLDFDLNPNNMSLPYIIDMTEKFNYQHRVTVGHVTKLSAIEPEKLHIIAEKMSSAGVQLTALPSTDLFLTGRDHQYNIPRGVAPLMPLAKAGVCCSISSNNIENPFTPYGDASQIRQANLYANVAQLATQSELSKCMHWISTDSARLMGLSNYGIEVGMDADVNFFNAQNESEVIATVLAPSMGLKRGKITFKRKEVELFFPSC